MQKYVFAYIYEIYQNSTFSWFYHDFSCMMMGPTPYSVYPYQQNVVFLTFYVKITIW